MNARGLLLICLTLIVGSILLVPVSVDMGVRSDMASMLSNMALTGGIAAAIMTVGADMDDKRTKEVGVSGKRR